MPESFIKTLKQLCIRALPTERVVSLELGSKFFENYRQLIIDIKTKFSTIIYPEVVFLNNKFGKEILDPSKPTLVAVTGPSGSGKGDVLKLIKEKEGIPFLKTATTRARRTKENGNDYDELEDAYTWMEIPEKYLHLIGDKNISAETIQAIKDELTANYGLLEVDFHAGNFYGVPKANIDNVFRLTKKVLLMETDINGLVHWKNVVAQTGEYNFISFFLIQDDLDFLLSVVSHRNNSSTRLREGFEALKKSLELTKYFVINSFNPDRRAGAELTTNRILDVLVTNNLFTR